MHLTLKFLGDVQENKIDSLIKELSTIKSNSFETSLKGVGVFPNLKNIRVVWAGFSEVTSINSLQEKIDNSLLKLIALKLIVSMAPRKICLMVI